MTATLASIQRHPLKSHGRETLDRVTLSPGRTLPWDRRWAVAHDAAQTEEGAWANCRNFMIGSRAPALTAINARLDEDRAEITLSHPARPEITFRPDDPAEAAGFIDWVRPLCPPGRAQPVRIHSAAEIAMTDTAFPSVSILSLASNRDLGARMGQELSPLRWRGNLWLDGLAPWTERHWIGRQIRIAGAVLQIEEPIVRCLATAANPSTGERDADTLGALQAAHGAKEFGVYARVIEGGTIRTGDTVALLP
ncbi:MAG: MOSC domain-containing protein [Defluviimonas sp.]|uniref:MOSC domain-containing protein n=1 Tax=Albidovulum sp. TaxID=1872424 RepID=UPI001D39A796|nr:MOSC domain-containing protein [Paracoccaceae bacterium]MCC0064674.1 MOSC domain-containing protein [Defluviimonas sp.]